MSDVIVKRDTCRMCGSRNLELVFQLTPSPIGDAFVTADKKDAVQNLYPIDLFLCRNCGLSQLIDVIAPEVLYRDYIYLTGSSLGLSEHFRLYANEMLNRYSFPPKSLAIDIGSNDGTLLRFFQEQGMRVLGIDPAREIANQATLDGVETLSKFFTPDLAEQIRCDYGPATLITANNVFANIDDLTTMLQGIHSLLSEDGIFVFESFYLADVIQNRVFDFIYHEHLSAFAVKPVQTFFKLMGLELFDVERVATKGGSLRYMVQHAGGPRQVSPSIASLIAYEEELGLYNPEMFKNFTAIVDELKFETRDLLQNLKAQGNSIAGFGASITGTTLIYHFEIGEFLDYLIDDNLSKQGRFSPGFHLPVFPADILYARKPDHVVILAWRFAEPIIKKHELFIDQGGHFIIPVPELKVI